MLLQNMERQTVKKENVTENLNRVIVSYLKNSLKYRVNVKQI